MSFKSPFMGKGENMQEIISKLNEFLEGGSVSMSALARALGISPGAISQFARANTRAIMRRSQPR